VVADRVGTLAWCITDPGSALVEVSDLSFALEMAGQVACCLMAQPDCGASWVITTTMSCRSWSWLWDHAGPRAASRVYQFTPLKARCLRHCRSPLGFLLHFGNFRGRLRDVRVGIYHGGYCVGCCWSLMLVLVAVGVMNMAWMVALTAVVFAEKIWRSGPGVRLRRWRSDDHRRPAASLAVPGADRAARLTRRNYIGCISAGPVFRLMMASGLVPTLLTAVGSAALLGYRSR
jgi:Predicted metal-binding integral membrane protein (DUF2182)